jgi:hypothetical protein
MHAASLAVPDCCPHEIENHWIAAKARPKNTMRKVRTINQKDLEHIALSLVVGGCAAAQMNHSLPVRTERAIIARAVPVKYCTTQYSFLKSQYGFFLEFGRLALKFRCSQTACLIT